MGSGLASAVAPAAPATASGSPHPRVVYHTYKYMWATGDRERSLKMLEDFTSKLQGRLKR